MSAVGEASSRLLIAVERSRLPPQAEAGKRDSSMSAIGEASSRPLIAVERSRLPPQAGAGKRDSLFAANGYIAAEGFQADLGRSAADKMIERGTGAPGDTDGIAEIGVDVAAVTLCREMRLL